MGPTVSTSLRLLPPYLVSNLMNVAVEFTGPSTFEDDSHPINPSVSEARRSRAIHISALPNEIQDEILSYLDLESVQNLGSTSMTIANIIEGRTGTFDLRNGSFNERFWSGGKLWRVPVKRNTKMFVIWQGGSIHQEQENLKAAFLATLRNPVHIITFRGVIGITKDLLASTHFDNFKKLGNLVVVKCPRVTVTNYFDGNDEQYKETWQIPIPYKIQVYFDLSGECFDGYRYKAVKKKLILAVFQKFLCKDTQYGTKQLEVLSKGELLRLLKAALPEDGGLVDKDVSIFINAIAYLGKQARLRCSVLPGKLPKELLSSPVFLLACRDPNQYLKRGYDDKQLAQCKMCRAYMFLAFPLPKVQIRGQLDCGHCSYKKRVDDVNERANLEKWGEGALKLLDETWRIYASTPRLE